MLADDSLLFIDTNKYLDLYRTIKGKEMLTHLEDLEKYIFVTKQVVNEVQRQKIVVAADFLKNQFKKMESQGFNLPDHWSSTINQCEKIREQMRKIDDDRNKVNAEVDALELSIIKQISCSEDEVSKALSSIFANFVLHTAEELQKARERKELGNPPGKGAGSIGDQLNWEQILTNFKGKRRLWIISRDSDYGITHNDQVFLNPFLYEELSNLISPEIPEVYIFKHLPTGINDFLAKTGVKDKQSLSPEVVEEIEEEEKLLPPLTTSNDNWSMIRDMNRFFNQREKSWYENVNQQLNQREKSWYENVNQQLNKREKSWYENVNQQLNQPNKNFPKI